MMLRPTGVTFEDWDDAQQRGIHVANLCATYPDAHHGGCATPYTCVAVAMPEWSAAVDRVIVEHLTTIGAW